MKKSNKKGEAKKPVLKGKTVEVAGTIVGIVVDEKEKTLLIRQARDSGDEIVLLEKAMYFEKTSVINCYWIKVANPDKSIRELPVKPLSVNCDIF